MKSKKILFAFIFLLQIHGASAGQRDQTTQTNKDFVEKSDESDPQSAKGQKEMTLDQLLDSARVAEDALQSQEAQKLDHPAEGEQCSDSPSPYNHNHPAEGEQCADFESSYSFNYLYGEGGEYELVVPADSQYGEEGDYEPVGPSDSQYGEGSEQSSLVKKLGKEQERGSIKSVEEEKSDHAVDTNPASGHIRRKTTTQFLDREAELSAEKAVSPSSNYENLYQSSDEEDADQEVKKTSRKKQPRQ